MDRGNKIVRITQLILPGIPQVVPKSGGMEAAPNTTIVQEWRKTLQDHKAFGGWRGGEGCQVLANFLVIELGTKPPPIHKNVCGITSLLPVRKNISDCIK